jgi:hypothetical protein
MDYQNFYLEAIFRRRVLRYPQDSKYKFDASPCFLLKYLPTSHHQEQRHAALPKSLVNIRFELQVELKIFPVKHFLL